MSELVKPRTEPVSLEINNMNICCGESGWSIEVGGVQQPRWVATGGSLAEAIESLVSSVTRDAISDEAREWAADMPSDDEPSAGTRMAEKTREKANALSPEERENARANAKAAMGLNPHEARLTVEKTELDERRTKLLGMSFSVTFSLLPERDQELVRLQLDLMEEYTEVLRLRLQRLAGDAVSPETTWTLPEARILCRKLEAIAPEFGCHVGLTGGLLYNQGPRKDCDVLLYRIRQTEAINIDGFFAALEKIGVIKVSGFGFCHKAVFNGKPIDFLCPEDSGHYPTEEGP